MLHNIQIFCGGLAMKVFICITLKLYRVETLHTRQGW